MNKASIKSNFKLDEKHLPLMKEVCKKILELNIALKEFNYENAPNTAARNMCLSSIENSKSGLEKIKNIENCESINDIFMRLGERELHLFFNILGVFSGTLNDDNFYDFDKEVSRWKKEQD